MKFAIILCVVSVVLLQYAEASPLKFIDHKERSTARQQDTNSNEVNSSASDAGADDDDEDDDDEDEPDLGDLIEDDDDDEDDDEGDDDDEEDDTPQGQAAPVSAADDDEEDDDDDDYLDRLFDDILGDDDEDEEDDDEDVPTASVQNTIPSQSSALSEEVAPVAQSSVAPGISDGVDILTGSGNAADDVPEVNGANVDAVAATSNNEGEQDVFYDENSNTVVDGISSSNSQNSDSESIMINKSSANGSSQIGSLSSSEQINLTTQHQLQQVQQQLITNNPFNTLRNTPTVTQKQKASASITNKKHNNIINHIASPSLSPTIAVATAVRPITGTADEAVASSNAVEDIDDDEEDDDDEDDDDLDDGVDEITGALTGDDDEADDEDEDDDDDDIIGDDVIEARREARESKTSKKHSTCKNSTSALKSKKYLSS